MVFTGLGKEAFTPNIDIEVKHELFPPIYAELEEILDTHGVRLAKQGQLC